MKITLEQYGSLAGIRRAYILDTAELDEGRDEVEGLARVVAASPVASGVVNPDAMNYKLIIEAEEGTQEVDGVDSSATFSTTPEFASLVEQVRKRGKPGVAIG